MGIGARNRRVRLQRRGETRDEAGQPSNGWIDVVPSPIWANIRTSNGKEFLAAGMEVSSVTASIRIRYREGITAGMRVLYRTTIYDIKAVLPDEAGRNHVDLAVATGANNG
jgi:SPP1 family predicted phage head-tail adaptor